MALPKKSKYRLVIIIVCVCLLLWDILDNNMLNRGCRETVETFEMPDQVQGSGKSTRAQSKTQKRCQEKTQKEYVPTKPIHTNSSII